MPRQPVEEYEVLRVDSGTGIRFRIGWSGGLMFHVHAVGPGAPEREVTVFHHGGDVVASWEHACDIAHAWWRKYGSEAVRAQIEVEHHDLATLIRPSR